MPSSFNSRGGYDGGGGKDINGHDIGARERMIAKIQDVKASPYAGKTRLVVREEGKDKSHAVIDVNIKDAKDLKSKEKYVFHVNERDDSKNPGFQRKRSATFKAYDCSEKPEGYVPGSEYKETFSRFGGSGNTKNSGRLKF